MSDSTRQTKYRQRRDDAFRKPGKTYGLMALVRGPSTQVGSGPDDTTLSWPDLMIAEVTLFMGAFAITLLLALLFDAPLKELANAAVPENPAKAPWYFLGLQELVSYSAFVGGVLVPSVVVVGLMAIPYLDRETDFVGVWFSGPMGRSVAWQSLVVSLVFVLSVVSFTIHFGWLRNWFPQIHQIVIIAINPGTILLLGGAFISLFYVRRTSSMRMGAIALFTYFLVGFLILTCVGTYFRGPNWAFYWSQSQWPGIHP